MSVYREIPLSFGTLVLVHPAEHPDSVQATWKVSPPASLYQAPNDAGCDSEAPDSETEKDPLDEEIVNVKSAATSGTEQEVSGAGDKDNVPGKASGSGQFSEAHLPVINAEFAPKLSPLPTLWADDAFGVTSPELSVKIGPTIHGTGTAQKPHLCEICGRPFRRKKDIRRHLETHSTSKPFYCWACCLTFRAREYLRRHLKRVHGQFSTYASRGGQSRLGPQVGQQQQQHSSEEPFIPELNTTEHTQSDDRKKEHGFNTISAVEQQGSPSQRRPAENVAEDVASGGSGEDADLRGTDIPVGAEKTDTKSPESIQSVVTNGAANSVPAPSKPSPQPRPKVTDASEPKRAFCPIYLCDGCGNITSYNNVMVLTNKQGTSASKPRVLCKICFIQKTGIICIGWWLQAGIWTPLSFAAFLEGHFLRVLLCGRFCLPWSDQRDYYFTFTSCCSLGLHHKACR